MPRTRHDGRLSPPSPRRPAPALCADDRQFRRRPPRTPGRSESASRAGGPARVAHLRAHVRAASARVLRCDDPRRSGTCPAAHPHRTRQARRVVALWRRPRVHRALQRFGRRVAGGHLRRRRDRRGHAGALPADRRRLPLRARSVRASVAMPCANSARSAASNSPDGDRQPRRRSASPARRCAPRWQSADFARGASLLGRPYAISGHVVHGRKLGRELGFPTLNLRIPHGRPGPRRHLRRPGARRRTTSRWPAVASLGTRPAVETQRQAAAGSPSCSTTPATLYGKLVRVEFLRQACATRRHYDGLDALTAQIRSRCPPGARLLRSAAGSTQRNQGSARWPTTRQPTPASPTATR
jgi:hypothetical protein